MKNRWLIYCIIGVALIGMSSCASSPDPQKRKEARATRDLGEAHMAAGNYTAALRELLKSEQMYADDHLLQNSLGITYINKGELELAIRHFKRAIELKPGYAPARNNLGSAYMGMKQWDAAIEEFEKVTQDMLYATPHFPLSNLGKAYYYKNDFPKAESYFKQALKREPGFLNAQLGLAQTYIARLRLQEAVNLLQSAIRQHPQAAPLYLALGEAYQLGKQYDSARQAYTYVIDLDPNGPLASEARAKVAQLP